MFLPVEVKNGHSVNTSQKVRDEKATPGKFEAN
jgi:hypothetical protein